MRTRSDIMVLLRAMLPPLIWFACFSFLYSFATLACGLGLLVGIDRYLSLALAAAVTVGLVAAARLGIGSHPFLTMVSRGLSGLAILAVLWLMVPLLMLEVCEAGRVSEGSSSARIDIIEAENSFLAERSVRKKRRRMDAQTLTLCWAGRDL